MANQCIAAVTPSDTPGASLTLFAAPVLRIGVTGNVSVLCGNDTTPTVLTAVPVGLLFAPTGARAPFTSVLATSTTATGIVAYSRCPPVMTNPN